MSIFDETRCSGRSGPQFIDVWPIDIVRPRGDTTIGWDNSCLFLLQLACILSMCRQWKKYTTLRVFLCVNSLQVVRSHSDALTCPGHATP